MNLSVIIPSRNVKNLVACMDALRLHEPAVHVICIDDGLSAMVASRTLPGAKPFVFARNINIGIRAAGDDDVILLNDDALLKRSGGFTIMQKYARLCPEVGAISATTNLSNNPAQYPRQGRALRDAGKAVAFVCVLIPRRTINLVGLLDERFTGEIDGEMIYGGEDTDYCYRVRQAGLKIGVHDGCFVDHASLQSTFRPHGGGLPINATRKRFREIHGVEMETC